MRVVDETVGVAAAVRVSNSWLLSDGEGRRFLIDTGHRLERPALARALRAAGVRGPGDLEAILLTHRHSDHAGNAAWARDTFRAPVICHDADARQLDGTQARPRLAGRGATLVHEALCHVEDRFPARSSVDEVFDEGDWRFGFHVVPVPGHTEGSVLLLHEPSGSLFSGDAILAGFPAQRFHVRLQLALPEYSVDVERCRSHVRSFLRTAPPVRTLCAGHGPPVKRRLRERFARITQS